MMGFSRPVPQPPGKPLLKTPTAAAATTTTAAAATAATAAAAATGDKQQSNNSSEAKHKKVSGENSFHIHTYQYICSVLKNRDEWILNSRRWDSKG